MAIVRAFRAAGMDVGICTNATALDDGQIGELADCGVHCNVSLDGLAVDSHGKFRGDRAFFDVTVGTVEKLGGSGILQGLLCTPNSLAQNEEFARLCAFARENGARYALLNLARHGTDTYRGMALACLCAADRHHQLEVEIKPALRAGEIVVCDRYLASSLVLQGLDGLVRIAHRH